MKMTMSQNELTRTILHQLKSFFFLSKNEETMVASFVGEGIDRCEICFAPNVRKYYKQKGQTYFDPLHGCQYATFLYYLSNSIFRETGHRELCDKLYALIKVLQSVDLYYEVELPDIFTFDHPSGSIIGRAFYSNYFSFNQGCTVGNNKGLYPSFGENVIMLADSKVIGGCCIGSNVLISANAFVKDQNVPSGSIVFGQSPDLVIKTGKEDFVNEYAGQPFKI